MLKLGQSARGIDIRLQDKERFFNRTLCQALGLALALHLGPFLLFHIKPFTIGPSFRFPPIQVQTEVNSLTSGYVLLNEMENEEISDLLPPPLLIPKSNPLFLASTLNPETSQTTNFPFESLEKRFLPISHAPSAISLAYAPIQVHLSGPLAQKKLLPYEIELFNRQGQLQSFEVQYEVQVDEKTGSIFWFDKTKSSGHPDIDQLAENKLLSLQFIPDHKLDGWTGCVNFILSLDEHD